MIEKGPAAESSQVDAALQAVEWSGADDKIEIGTPDNVRWRAMMG